MKPLNLLQTAVCLVMAWGSTLGQAQSGSASITRMQVMAQSDAPDLQCGLPRSKLRPTRHTLARKLCENPDVWRWMICLFAPS